MQEKANSAIAAAVVAWYNLQPGALTGERVVGAAAEARRAFIVLAVELGQSVSDCARFLGIDRSSASRMAKAVNEGETAPTADRLSQLRAHVHSQLATHGIGVVCHTCGGSGRILSATA